MVGVGGCEIGRESCSSSSSFRTLGGKTQTKADFLVSVDFNIRSISDRVLVIRTEIA